MNGFWLLYYYCWVFFCKFFILIRSVFLRVQMSFQKRAKSRGITHRRREYGVCTFAKSNWLTAYSMNSRDYIWPLNIWFLMGLSMAKGMS